ncbi:MAG: LCP family protein [Terrisporobacter sp.]|uniref:LCP family protein n=1 Tax=Terrisporobacter sp. TaxID=1965305 RepID=UPI002FC6BE93
MRKLKKIVVILIAIIIIIPVGVYGYLHSKLGNITVDSKYTSKLEEVDGITNILLLGTDGRQGESSFRTDSMIILTIDNNNKNIKLTSLARDTYVDMPGQGKGKLNSAYFWGKEPLLFETIENKFGIGIDKFVIVDFTSLMDIIYVLDGVEVDVSETEISEVNKFIPECYNFSDNDKKGSMELLTTTGKQTLNGYQALSYSRIRKKDSAINRDERQREIILAIIDKYKDMSPTKYPALLDVIIPYITTNLTTNEIFDLGYTSQKILSGKSINDSIKQMGFPIIDDIHSKGGIYNNAGWVWLYDVNSTVVLKDFIYNNIDPKDNAYLKDNSNVQLNY